MRIRCLAVLLLVIGSLAWGQDAPTHVHATVANRPEVKLIPNMTIGAPPSVQLSWQPSTTTGVSYNVYDATVSKGEAKPVLGNTTATTFTDTTLQFGVTRYYAVTACAGCASNGTGGAESTMTNEVSVQIPVQPAPPGTLAPPNVVYP